LVQDRVDCNSGLTGLAVTNDELTLSTTDRGHGVNGLDTSLQRLVHWLAAHDARRLDFHTAHLDTNKVSLTVNWLTNRVDDATKNTIT
jgi:hypothetical protein